MAVVRQVLVDLILIKVFQRLIQLKFRPLTSPEMETSYLTYLTANRHGTPKMPKVSIVDNDS